MSVQKHARKEEPKKREIRRELEKEGYRGEDLEFLTDTIYRLYTIVKRKIESYDSVLLRDVVYPFGTSGYYEDDGVWHVKLWFLSAHLGEDDPDEVYAAAVDMLQEIMKDAVLELAKEMGVEINEDELEEDELGDRMYFDVAVGGDVPGEVNVDLYLGDFLKLKRS